MQVRTDHWHSNALRRKSIFELLAVHAAGIRCVWAKVNLLFFRKANNGPEEKKDERFVVPGSCVLQRIFISVAMYEYFQDAKSASHGYCKVDSISKKREIRIRTYIGGETKTGKRVFPACTAGWQDHLKLFDRHGKCPARSSIYGNKRVVDREHQRNIGLRRTISSAKIDEGIRNERHPYSM